MEEYSPPRNQQSRFEPTRESKSIVMTSEANLSQSRSSMEILPETELHQTDQEIDMLSCQRQSQEFQINDNGNACFNCHNCGQTLRMHSTPVKTGIGHRDVSQNSLQQIGSVLSDNITAPFNMSRVKTATNMSHTDEYMGDKKKDEAPPPGKEKREKKEKKTITSKTFAHGLMDMSLMTSNASQLRAVMSNPGHEFYQFLIWLLVVSVILQIVSGLVLIISDFYKSQIKEKDRQNQKKRKTLNFVALGIMMLITSLNVIITAFNTPSSTVYRTGSVPPTQQPMFSSSDYQLHSNHTEL